MFLFSFLLPTLPHIESIHKDNPLSYQKMRFYLSKADEAGTPSDRQKVIIQITQVCALPL
jgi:hypothetical protein